MDVTTATPAQIDEVLADVLGRRDAAMDRADRSRKIAADPRYAHNADRYLEEAAKYDAIAEQQSREALPLLNEFTRRGGWTRAWVVQGGHVHRTHSCFTLTPGVTRVGWLTEVSGMTDEQIIELAGERACTFCYPGAPVATLGRPSRLREDVAAREAAEAKAAADASRKAAKEAKRITDVDGSPLTIMTAWGTDRIETVAAAWQTAVDMEVDPAVYYNREMTQLERSGQAVLVGALAAKLGWDEDGVRAELAKKVAAKTRRVQREIAKA